MPLHNSKSVDTFGADNMRGLSVKNVGYPRYGTDALTWAIPSYTTTLRDAIPSPATGIIIFNSTTLKLNFWDGVAWRAITSV